MDVIFDTIAADQLILQMDYYCTGIMWEARDLLEIMKEVTEWEDNQSKAFKNIMTELAKDLNNALQLESEYMKTFRQRVLELRG